MGLGSGIEWTEATWNPAPGSNKVSPGCRLTTPNGRDDSGGGTFF